MNPILIQALSGLGGILIGCGLLVIFNVIMDRLDRGRHR